MKKLLYVFVLLSFIASSCDKSSDGEVDQLKKENQELRDALAANAKIEKVEFEDGKMILTYTNGITVKTDIPEVLKGEPGTTPRIGDNGNWWIGDTDTGVVAQGQNGEAPHIGENGNWWVGDTDTGVAAMGKDGMDGVGIESITYDEETGVMTITLTNGQSSKFVINNDEGDLSAVIMEDLNGAYLVKSVKMGDLKVADLEYDENYQLVKATNFIANGYQALKNFEIAKEYVNGLPAKILSRQFATEKTVKYSDDWYENTITRSIKFNEDKGEWFLEANSDGSYYYYDFEWEHEGVYSYYRYYAVKDDRMENEMVSIGNGKYTIYDNEGDRAVTNSEGQEEYYYVYRVYDECILADENPYEYEISEKVSDTQFKIYYRNSAYIYYNGNSRYQDYYRLEHTRTIDGSYEAGDLMEEVSTRLEYNSNNQLEKIYEMEMAGEEATAYLHNYYNAQGNIEKTERFYKEDGNWVKDPYFLMFEYNAQNQLTRTIENDEDGNEKEIGRIEYDQEGNPIEIFKYYGAVINERWLIDPNTGLYAYYEETVAEAGMYSVAKLEYNYTMKNFFGHSFGVLFPQLYGFNFNNALKRGVLSGSLNAGSIEYKDFNDGGYPTTMEFIGASMDYPSFVGQLKIEYLKKEE